MASTAKNLVKGNGRTILFVDDEKTLRDMVGTMLKVSGYRVLTAANGSEGLEVFRTRHKDIHAVILDWTMPGLTCCEVIQRLHQLKKSLPTIVISGHPQRLLQGQMNGNGQTRFLQKPFGLDQLRETLGQVLEA
ncbi:MAG: response regulator [Desulfarculaceae bacterium]|jgi:CheY-like chemotaxis protein